MASQNASNPYILPTSLHPTPTNTSQSSKSWRQHFTSLSPTQSHTNNLPRHANPAYQNTPTHLPHNTNTPHPPNPSNTTNPRSTNEKKTKWYKIHWGKGMINDVKRRAPFYWSDWADAWDYRVVPASVYMYFANILPALAFSLDMFTKTNMSYGVNEVLLSSVLGAVVFSIFAAQPLVIVGVTGPITVFNYTVYDIMVPTGTNYFAFMALIGIWSLLFHTLLALTNSCNALKYVTRFSCDIFGFYVAFIYLQKGIQVLTRQGSSSPFYLSITISLLVLIVGYLCGVIGNGSLFQHYIRTFIKDYGTPLTVIFFTGFVYIGKMRGVELSKLPTGKAFEPTASGRGWFIHFWDVSVGDVFIAIPFAVLLTVLFWFDHNVSSLISQGTEFPLLKPSGFHHDLFLLGLTTFIASLLGIPFPNGLIPQAPFHTASLCVTKTLPPDPTETSPSQKGHATIIIDHVVEQRVSNLAQGLLTLFTMTGPLLIVLGLIPQAVLAGLFFVMGVQALEGNGITIKLFFLFKDKSLTARSEPLKGLKRRKVWLFVGVQIVGFGATFAVTQTIAAVGFPIIILLLIPLRTWVLPRWFGNEELAVLDKPTASPFTMISVGGNHGEVDGDGDGDGDSGETEVQSGSGDTSEGVVGAGEGRDSEEGKAERGEGMKRRESWRGDGGSGIWGSGGGENGSGEAFEMKSGVSRRRSKSRLAE